MEIVPIKIVHGENKSWDIISELDCEAEACARTKATFSGGSFTLKCFGADFTVTAHKRELRGAEPGDPVAALMLGPLKDFFRLSVLWYFTSAINIPPTGRLLKPLDVKGGQRFFAGTHMLPMAAIAEKYAHDKDGFMAQARKFGGEPDPKGPGDACVVMYPLPRVPITLVLWMEDEEFPPRADLFFDTTINFQISLSDIVWSLAMMCCLVFLEDEL